MKKQVIVIHSGGMDSSICLALAIKEFQKKDILSLTFDYCQRHSNELRQAKKICIDWKVDHTVINIDCLKKITKNALTNSKIRISHTAPAPPNTLVTGRNGLMVRLAAVHAESLGANYAYTGVIEAEEANSGYRDCSRSYMDLMQTILRIDLANPYFEIRTPLVFMTKEQTLETAEQLGILQYLLEETITCYEGLPRLGCKICPACVLRNEGIKMFHQKHPEIALPYLP